MSHNINGFIGPIEELQRLTIGVKSAKIALLDVEGYGFLPYTTDLSNEMGKRWYDVGRNAKVPIVHVETDYFGGAGDQSAAFFDGKGAKTFKEKKNGAIDRALKLLGIKTLDGLDEFDTLGLGNFRSNQDWAERANIANDDEAERLEAIRILDRMRANATSNSFGSTD